jgi:hypothetical protein
MDQRPHLFPRETGTVKPYTYPRMGGSSKFRVPPRDRIPHSQSLVAQIKSAEQQAAAQAVDKASKFQRGRKHELNLLTGGPPIVWGLNKKCPSGFARPSSYLPETLLALCSRISLSDAAFEASVASGGVSPLVTALTSVLWFQPQRRAAPSPSGETELSRHPRHATAADGDCDLPLPHTRDATTLLCSTAYDGN